MTKNVITIKNLIIQFDADEYSELSAQQQAEKAIEQINGVLQREPYGLGAQIMNPEIYESDVSGMDIEL